MPPTLTSVSTRRALAAAVQAVDALTDGKDPHTGASVGPWPADATPTTARIVAHVIANSVLPLHSHEDALATRVDGNELTGLLHELDLGASHILDMITPGPLPDGLTEAIHTNLHHLRNLLTPLRPLAEHDLATSTTKEMPA